MEFRRVLFRSIDLWRGVGIACSYVGGSDENILRKLFSSAQKNYVQLSIGAAMVAKSRTHANSITKDIELACNVWCNLSVQDPTLLAFKEESSADCLEFFISKLE